MKRAALAFLILIVVTSCLACPRTSLAGAKYSSGTGEPNDPYQIATAADLNDIGNHPEDFNKCFIMTGDIDMSGISGNEYRIIGSEANPFTGVFDGDKHTISNFSVRASGYVGLFGYVNGAGAAVKNVGLIDVNVQGGSAGGLVSYMIVWGTNSGISNCYVKGGTVTGSGVGGLVGSGSGKISNCYTTCNVSGGGSGGIVCFYQGPEISYCYSTGTITANSSRCGGIVGENYGRIYRCYSTGDILSSGGHTGGLVGLSADCTLEECWSTSNVTDTGQAGPTGGLVGVSDAWMGPARIINCYARGSVVGPSSSGSGEWDSYVGGLAGVNSAFWADATIEHCYSSGYVSGVSGRTGGLIGLTVQSSGTAFYIDPLWDIETSNQSTSDGGFGETTAWMKTRDLYEGAYLWLDFGTIWRIHEGVDYPKLLWAKGRLAGLYEVELDDIKALTVWWLRNDCAANNECDNADINFSGKVDFKDFALIAQNWLQGL
jgi:hypothetical protein